MSYDHRSYAIALPLKEMLRLRRSFVHPHRHTSFRPSGHRASATAGQRSIQHIAQDCDAG